MFKVIINFDRQALKFKGIVYRFQLLY